MSYTVTSAMGMSVIPSILVAMVICTLLGMLIEGFAYKPLRGTSSLAVLITAIGVSYFLQNAAQLIWGPAEISFKRVVTAEPLLLFGGQLRISAEVLVTLAVAVVIMVGLTLFVNKTQTGKAMRAVSEDRDAAQLMGINVNRTISITFAIGSALAAVAGVLLCSKVQSVWPTVGSMPGIRAFTAAVFGGIGSIHGAMLGGMLLGLIETMTGAYISTQFSDAIVFLVLIVVLLVRPAGLLGKNVQEKV
jgi:branched-chain amino acid transport system permease protein